VSGDIYVTPGNSVQAAIDAAPEGAVIVLRSGVHRRHSLTPKRNQTLTGEAGAILSGAKELSGFFRSGGAWIIGGQTQQGEAYIGECQPGFPRCIQPEELYINDVRLAHVGRWEDGGPGRWFFDYGSDQIVIWDDPTGRRVETSVGPYAIGGHSTGVTIRNLTIEKYATGSQQPTIGGYGTGWTVEGNLVRFNHGIGIGLAPNRRILNNIVVSNGQLGIGGAGQNVLVEGNEIAYNNTAGYNPYWEGGGTKFVRTDYLVLRNNFVHHNNGHGLHADIDNLQPLIESNRAEDNTLCGIFLELGYGGIIRYNTLNRNGSVKPDPFWVDGAGILVFTTSDVEVYGNTLVNNWNGITGLHSERGSGRFGPRVLSNYYVHDNDIDQRGVTGVGGGRSGIFHYNGTAAFTDWNNRYVNNTYRIRAGGEPFFWMNREINAATWRSYGLDLAGIFSILGL
jgi:parallel beta-helix repeat protein